MDKELDLQAALTQLFTQLQEGERVPSERALAEQFGVSRATIKRALLQLGAQGVLVLNPGHCPRIAKPVGVPLAIERLLQIEPGLESELGRFVRDLKADQSGTYPDAVNRALSRLVKMTEH
ncbi:MAG TPA: GntR family transcriptional regulator [Marinobacterium sp.]|nr:GntR family transcriptional regulator [Marinobacterium sp.]